MDYDEMNQRTIKEFRANKGVVGGQFEDMSLLLLHHIGAKSGTARVSPLVYHRHVDGEDWIVFAAAGGAPNNPDWHYNLLANPATTVELGTETVAVNARVAGGSERKRIWEALAPMTSVLTEYEESAGREIPVVVLERS